MICPEILLYPTRPNVVSVSLCVSSRTSFHRFFFCCTPRTEKRQTRGEPLRDNNLLRLRTYSPFCVVALFFRCNSPPFARHFLSPFRAIPVPSTEFFISPFRAIPAPSTETLCFAFFFNIGTGRTATSTCPPGQWARRVTVSAPSMPTMVRVQGMSCTHAAGQRHACTLCHPSFTKLTLETCCKQCW